MASPYIPITVNAGFTAEREINANLRAIKAALDTCVQRRNDLPVVTANPLDVSLSTYSTVFYDLSSQAGTNAEVVVKGDGTTLFALNLTTRAVHQFNFGTAGDVTTLTAVTSLALSGFSIIAIAVSPDGTRLYSKVLSGSHYIYQYNMSSAWDISTATSAGSFNLSTSGVPNAAANDFMIANDGSKFYTYATTGPLYSFTFGTPNDISTLTYDSVSGDTTTETDFPRSGFFWDDGAVMVVGDDSDDQLNQYTLSVPYAVSTLAYDNKMYDLGTNLGVSSIRPVSILDSGKKMYLTAAGVIYELGTNV